MSTQRLTLRRRLSYNTNKNARKVVKTPGGKLVYIYIKKRGTIPKCGDCKKKLSGVAASRPHERSKMTHRKKTVNRAYGGVRCHTCLRQRIVRSFMVEEQKNMKLVFKEAQKSKK